MLSIADVPFFLSVVIMSDAPHVSSSLSKSLLLRVEVFQSSRYIAGLFDSFVTCGLKVYGMFWLHTDRAPGLLLLTLTRNHSS
jgi:hypothetical protein